MKVLLIKHPTTHFQNTAPPVSGIPLGLLYVAAALERVGHEVHVYDAIVQAGDDRWGDTCSGGMYRMGATWEEVKEVVNHHQPDIVGISNQYTSQVSNAIRTAEAVKEVNRDITVVVGGPHTSVMPDTFFGAGSAVDFAVLGEGEITMVELLASLQSGGDRRSVRGIAYLDMGNLVVTEKRPLIMDMDTLPLPAYHLVDMERYFYFNKRGKDGRESYAYPGSERSLSMITSRGCPFNCVFCSIHLSMGRKFRAHSVEYVQDHIARVKDAYGINHIHFEDDNFSFEMKRFHGILDGMMERHFRLTWDTPNGVRADYLDAGILKKCRDSGCTYLRIGVESACEEVSRNIVRKRLDLKKVVEIAGLCRDIGIDLEAFYIIGFPGEKVEQMSETINFAITMEQQHGLYPYDMFTATPLIGTDLYRICQKRGYLSKQITSENLAVATQGQGMITTEDFTPEIVRGLLHGYRKRHLRARILYSLKFIIKHPFYLVFRLSDRLFWRSALQLARKGALLAIVDSLFFYRYRNCVLRKVGAR